MVSYEKDGAPRETPLTAIEVGGMLYARTNLKSNKVRRIRANPHVRVAVSDLSGKPKGTWIGGEAQVLEGDECTKARKAFRREYGFFGSLLTTLMALWRRQHLDSIISIRLERISSGS